MSAPAEILTPPLSLKALLDGALRRVREHLGALYLPYALPLVLGGGAAAALQLRLTYLPGGGVAPPGTQLLVSLVVGLASGLLYGLVYAAMIVAAADVVSGRGWSPPSRIWLTVLRPRFLGTQLLAGIVLLAGLGCCLIPGIYLALVLSLIVPVMIEEARFGTTAIRRSITLMHHNPRGKLSVDPRVRSFLLNFAGMLIGSAINVVVGFPTMVVTLVLMLRAAAQGQQADAQAVMRQVAWIQVPSSMLGMLVQGLVFLYMAFGVALLYADVVKRKEGADLLAAAERLARSQRGGD